MNHNHLFRRIIDAFDLNHDTLMSICSQAGLDWDDQRIERWLEPIDKKRHEPMNEQDLAQFLDALIDYRRGKKEGAEPRPPQPLTNNVVLRKLMIALEMQAVEALGVLETKGIVLSKHELSALFRKVGHKHYRECSDEVLNGFLDGLEFLDLWPDQS
ncbi:MAG: DUF1456 family protein [Gammaproteobacteria bacterium]